MLDPSTWSVIDWPPDQPPMVVVVVDTEAEFDWARQEPRRAMGVTSVKLQMQVQRIFERYAVRPTYVLDYPVSTTREAYGIIRYLHRSGACEIGAHLQPWDNPPFVERKTDENSYPGNLPLELEREKLMMLSRGIEENIGVWPRIYKAGRYGVGHATARTLAELGYQIDLSVVPGTDLAPVRTRLLALRSPSLLVRQVTDAARDPTFDRLHGAARTHRKPGLCADNERDAEGAAYTGRPRAAASR
jgi:hypothetical protein